MLVTTPLHTLFGAEIAGIDLRHLHEEDATQVRALLDRYAVCLFRLGVPLSAAEQVQVSRLLGPLDDAATFMIAGVRRRLTIPHIQDVSNLGEDGNLLPPDSRLLAFRRGDRLWHTDISFHPNRGVYSLLSARILPPSGGKTQFVDMRAVYEALPAPLQERIEPLVAEHSIWHSRRVSGFPEPTQEELASCPPVSNRLVCVHPGSARKTLYLASHISRIVDLAPDESDALLAQLRSLAARPPLMYTHEWRVGDLVIWDNRITMHRATEYEDTLHVRELYRTTTRDRAGLE